MGLGGSSKGVQGQAAAFTMVAPRMIVGMPISTLHREIRVDSRNDQMPIHAKDATIA